MVAEVCPFVGRVQQANVKTNKKSSWKYLINIAPNGLALADVPALAFRRLKSITKVQ